MNSHLLRSSVYLIEKKMAAAIQYCLTSEVERKDLEEAFSKHPPLRRIMNHIEDVLRALQIISAIKPNIKLATSQGISLYHTDDTFLQVKRTFYRDNRVSNITSLGHVFVAAFKHLDEQFCLYEQRKDSADRTQQVLKELHRTNIEQLLKSILHAKQALVHMHTTYCDDANTIARIQTLGTCIEQKLKLTQTNMNLLKLNSSLETSSLETLETSSATFLEKDKDDVASSSFSKKSGHMSAPFQKR